MHYILFNILLNISSHIKNKTNHKFKTFERQLKQTNIIDSNFKFLL